MSSTERKRPVQGDHWPFSMPQRPKAIVRHHEILSILRRFALPPNMPEILSGKLSQIVGVYLGELSEAEAKLNHARSLKTLGTVSATSKKLADQLSSLKNEYLVAIEAYRGTVRGEPAPKFEMLRLVPTLERLANAAQDASASMKPSPPHRVANKARQEVICAILDAFDSDELRGANLAVEPINASSQKRIDGLGGKIIAALFEHFDPHFDVPAPWGVIAPMLKRRKSGG